VPRLAQLTTLLLLFSFVSACATLGRHKELEKRVLALEKFQRDTTAVLQRDVTRLENLNQRIQKATAELRRYGAGLAAKVEGQEEAGRQLLGRIEELQHLTAKFSEDMGAVRKFLDRKFGFSLVKLPANTPKQPDKLYSFAISQLKANKIDLARALFQHFVKHHSNHPRALTAGLNIGETYRMQRRYKDALKAYFAVYEPWANRTKKAPPEVPIALWLAAKALQESGACRKSIDMYKEIIRSFRKSPEATKAKQKLKTLKCN